MVIFAVFGSSLVEGFSSAVSSVAKDLPTIPLKTIDQRQLAILDGAEWASIQALSKNNGISSTNKRTKYGYMNVVVGKDSTGSTIVGMQFNDELFEIYEESAAKVPTGIKAEDALATYIASLSTIHAVLPRSENVGGSSDNVIISGKVVVVGSSELACFAAEGLASFGVNVCMVSTGNPKVKEPSKKVGKSK